MQIDCAVPSFVRNWSRVLSNKHVSCFAHEVSNELPQRGVLQSSLNWTGKGENAFHIAGKHGDTREILKSFCQMNGSGAKPTRFVLCTALNSCVKTLNMLLGLQIHAYMVRSGYEENLFLNSALVDLYAKFGVTVDARRCLMAW